MSDTQIIGASIQVDTGTSDANVAGLNKAVTDLKGNLKDAGATVKQTSGAVTDAGGSFSKLKDSIALVPGPLGDTADGVGKLSEAFKVLLANPVVLVITAIVAALTFLAKAFTNSFEGGEKMEQVFAGIKAAAGALLDSILNIGSAIIKFFSGDFKGALEDAKAGVDGLVHGVVNAYNQVSDLTKKMQELHKQQLANDLDDAKRTADLAKLREDAYDDSVPVAKRIENLKTLQKAQQEDAVKDLALAKQVADTKIALLSIGKDAALKNMDEINKIRVDLINQQTESANEGRRIGRSVTQAEKQELQERTAARKAAEEEAKKNREQLDAYSTQLRKLQQANALAGITDQYAKEKQLLENKLADEAAVLQKDFQSKKLTRDQFNKLEAAQQESAQIQRAALTDKHQKEIADKEQSFQNDLNKIKQDTALKGITDSREAEMVQLQIGYQEKLAQAIKTYKDNAVQFQQIKDALDAQLKAQEDALRAKNKAADDKKAFKEKTDALKLAITDKKNTNAQKIADIDADKKLLDQAFKDKLISEQEYNDAVKHLSDARNDLRKKETQNQIAFGNSFGDVLNGLSQAAGESTQLGKDLAIAGATIKAISAVISIISGFSEAIPGPWGLAAGIAASAAVAVGLYNNIKQIESVQIPGQSGGGSSSAAPAAMAAPLAPTQQGTQLPQSQINQMGNAATAAANNNRVYVLDADVQNSADRNARLNRAARLGG